jgi:hypothetical protein
LEVGDQPGRWLMHVNSSTQKWKQEDYKFEASLGYIARPVLTKRKLESVKMFPEYRGRKNMRKRREVLLLNLGRLSFGGFRQEAHIPI